MVCRRIGKRRAQKRARKKSQKGKKVPAGPVFGWGLCLKRCAAARTRRGRRATRGGPVRACVWGAKALRKNTHRTPPLNVERRRNGKPQTKRVLSGKSWFVRARVTRAREPASAVPRARTGALELWHRLALGFAHSRNKLGHTGGSLGSAHHRMRHFVVGENDLL